MQRRNEDAHVGRSRRRAPTGLVAAVFPTRPKMGLNGYEQEPLLRL